ncbi:MAG: replicative DNA helicase [Clostridia bacterium]|nr:replicative DNA helicase [Clostridia bacterium]
MANEHNTMPYNRDAEMALLGCFLIDTEIAAEMIDKVSAEDFYVEAHKYIVAAMKKAFVDRKPIDIVTVADELDGEGNLDKVGGYAYLNDLAQVTPSAANYQSYYDIVSRDGTNRRLIRAARKIIENSMSGAEEQNALAFAEKSIYDISREMDTSSLKGMAEGDIVGEVLHKFEALQSDPDAYRGVSTGFKHFDRITNGLQGGALVVLAARPGMGKTSLAMNIVEHAALRKNKVCAVFSLEMPRAQIVQRLVCSYAGVSMAKALRKSKETLNNTEWQKLMLASDKLRQSKIFIDDSSRITPSEILSKCRRLKTTSGGLDLVMIDYIQLMSAGTNVKDGGAENRQQEVAQITRELKIMAKELDVPILALSQLRRIQSKEPTLSDLRESGAIEQDADIVMFINRPEATATQEEIATGKIIKGAAQLILAKHRDGEQGRIDLRFIGESTKFVDVDEQNRSDEPPQFGRPKVEVDYDNDEEYEYEDDGYIPPEPPASMTEKEEMPF